MKIVRIIVHYGLLAVIIIYVVTGFGITEARTVTSLSLGLLDKRSSFLIHSNLMIPLIALLAAHLCITMKKYFAARRNLPPKN